MKKTYRDKFLKQELYLGEHKKKPYFEGWYFKHVDSKNKYSISIIVGISKSDDSHSFIQIIDNIKNKSYYVKYKEEDFRVTKNPFEIKIGENIFSKDKIYINIKDPISFEMNIKYKGLTPIDKTIYSPNIMGPFAYLTFLECNHCVISLRHKLKGYVKIYNKKRSFDNGTGYIEKDYGSSFPKRYLWLQSNSNKESSLFLAVAHIPMLKTSFQGLISIFEYKGKQYRFATYLLGKAKVKKLNSNEYRIQIKQGKWKLDILLTSLEAMELISPKNGNMKDIVEESLTSKCTVLLYKNDKKIAAEYFEIVASEVFNYK